MTVSDTHAIVPMASPSDCLKGRLLVATPALDQGFFAGSITYICEHGESGAMGVAINKPLDVEFEEILEHLDIEKRPSAKPAPVLAGGPVKMDHGFVLHSRQGPWESSQHVADDIWLTTSRDILVAIGEGHCHAQHLITLGYAGWAAGQLEAELSENCWLTVAANHTILFETPLEDRLRAAGDLMGFDISLMSGAAGHA